MDQDRRLADKLALATRRLQWEVAAMQFQLATRQLRDALIELRYNPDQPRVPAGNLDGDFDLETGDIFYHGEWLGNLGD